MTGTHVVTRIFGLRPYSTGGFRDGQATCSPKNRHRAHRKSKRKSQGFGIIPFEEHQKVVNTYIQAGSQLPAIVFERDSMISVKSFYDQVRKQESVKEQLQGLSLKERVRRCAAQYAYFSLKEHVHRGELLSRIAGSLVEDSEWLSQTWGYLETQEFPKQKLHRPSFPNRAQLRSLETEWLEEFPDRNGLVQRDFLRNSFAQVRNILLAELKNGSQAYDWPSLLKCDSSRKSMQEQVFSSLKADLITPEVILENMLGKYLKRLSSRLTWRVDQLRKHPEWTFFGIKKLARLDMGLREITGKRHPCDLQPGEWDNLRKQWRDKQFTKLKEMLSYELSLIGEEHNTGMLDDFLHELIRETFDRLSAGQLVQSLLKPRGITPPVIDVSSCWDFLEFMRPYVEREIVHRVMLLFEEPITESVFNALRKIRDHACEMQRLPRYKAHSVPLGLDDGQVYQLALDGRTGSPVVSLSLVARETQMFELTTPQRFHKMIEQGFIPKRGVLIRPRSSSSSSSSSSSASSMTAGGKLKLAVPFERGPRASAAAEHEQDWNIKKKVQGSENGQEGTRAREKLFAAMRNGKHWKKSRKKPGRVRVVGVDLGLKHFAVVSVHEHLEGKPEDSKEIFRIFLDQKQLMGLKEVWFLPRKERLRLEKRGVLKPTPPWTFNVKRKLTVLQYRGQKFQSEMVRYRNEYRERVLQQKELQRRIMSCPATTSGETRVIAAAESPVRARRVQHNKCYSFLRSEYKRSHAKTKRIHLELARQIAARLVSLCLYYEVDELLFEDLGWSQHSPRSEAGRFLSANQVHWFHSEIQERASQMASRHSEGQMAVDFLDARYSSQVCSKCGKLGVREGKLFKCLNAECGMVLDSDLNAARNVATGLHLEYLDAIVRNPTRQTRSSSSIPPLTETTTSKTKRGKAAAG